MGRRTFNPGWEPTLGELIARGIRIQVTCDRCDTIHLIDLEQLAARVGADYCLFNRRCRCRMTPGCAGWNRFFHDRGGVFIPFRDDATAWRWLLNP